MKTDQELNMQQGEENNGNGNSIFLLLIACFFFIFILPIIPDLPGWIPIITLSVIVFLAASSISKRVILFSFVTIAIEIITKATNLTYMHYVAEVSTNLFIVWIVITVILKILKRREVSIYTLVEALNGYLLLGIMFASLVTFVELHMSGSFSRADLSGLGLVYYTFITLTTTGYGDVVPVTSTAESLSLLIAIVGQFYVAVIVAVLVGKYSGSNTKQSGSN